MHRKDRASLLHKKEDNMNVFKTVISQELADQAQACIIGRFFDLPIVVMVEEPNKLVGIMTNQWLEKTGHTKDWAEAQCLSREYEVQSIADALHFLGGMDVDEDSVDLMVATNSLDQTMSFGSFGASILVDEKGLETIRKQAEKEQSDLYILPSSVHEVLLLPAYESFEVKELASIVRDVNTTLQKKDVLSGHVFVYRLNSGKIELAA